MVRFVNGDLKRVEAGTGVVVYTYAAARTTHTMDPSGLEVFEFPNGQVRLWSLLPVPPPSLVFYFSSFVRFVVDGLYFVCFRFFAFVLTCFSSCLLCFVSFRTVLFSLFIFLLLAVLLFAFFSLTRTYGVRER